MILPKQRDPRFITIRRGGSLQDADHRLLALWAADCAEHVLHLFTERMPADDRPARAIAAARAWGNGEMAMLEARAAGGHAMGAVRELSGAARYAAYAAGQAAAVAHVAAHELGAAAYAIKAARAAAPPGESENAGRRECRWQRERLPEPIRALVLDDQCLRNEICWFVFDMDTEEPLTGGNMSAVSRVGDTVRRTAGPWTPQVHFLLAHLRARGIRETPVPLGFDEQGREILSFIPGQVGHEPTAQIRSDAVLVAAARLLRRIHDAAAEIAHVFPAGWQAPVREPVEVICHGDFAPYNCVFDRGELVGVIDFDHAHPGSRAWDLAYALYRFVPITAPSNPEHYSTPAEQCRGLRLFCDAYGLAERSDLIQTVQARIACMADFLRQGAVRGDERMLANIAAGHLEIYTTDHAYLAAHAEQFQQALSDL